MKTCTNTGGSEALSPELLYKINAYWNAANYLSVVQLYLKDNPLLRKDLAMSDVKSMLLGHWGTTPGQNFIYVHLNRVIKKYDLNMIYISGPGHGGPALAGNTYYRYSRDTGQCTTQKRDASSSLANDCIQIAQRLDRGKGSGWHTNRRSIPRPPNSSAGGHTAPRPSKDS
jgi:phosphoketolase